MSELIFRLFLGLVFVVTFLLTSNYLWDRFNHTKLAPIVKLDVGKIQGVVLTQSGIEAEYFLGIPFAEPPIEENRFEVRIVFFLIGIYNKLVFHQKY